MPKAIQESGAFNSTGGKYFPPEYFDSGAYKKESWHSYATGLSVVSLRYRPIKDVHIMRGHLMYSSRRRWASAGGPSAQMEVRGHLDHQVFACWAVPLAYFCQQKYLSLRMHLYPREPQGAFAMCAHSVRSAICGPRWAM